jgi:hypothetical protein
LHVGIRISDNPEYLKGELVKARKSDEFDSVEIVELDVNEKDLTAILFPAKCYNRENSKPQFQGNCYEP